MPGTRGEKITRFVSQLAQALPDARGQAHSGNSKRMKLSSVIRALGLERRSARVLSDLDTALKEAGIYCDRPLSDRSSRLSTLCRFSKAPFPPDAMFFQDEAALKHLVMAHIGNYGPLRSLVLVGEEVRVGNSRVDLLCEEPFEPGRPLVVIELKKGADSDRLAGQLARYVDNMRAQPEYRGRPIKVVVITAGDDQRVIELLEVKKALVQCFRYSIELQPVGQNRTADGDERRA
jgi:hypothetical protein